MLDKIGKFREYLDYLEEHYNNVQKAWKIIKDKCPSGKFRFLYDDYSYWVIEAAVLDHDVSKLSAEEFTQYRQFFFPTEEEEDNGKKDKDLMKTAWEHHKSVNNHHWENWTKELCSSPCVDVFVVLMVIDWMAMGIKFKNTARDYYEKNKDKIVLPEWAITLMYEIFDYVYPKNIK